MTDRTWPTEELARRAGVTPRRIVYWTSACAYLFPRRQHQFRSAGFFFDAQQALAVILAAELNRRHCSSVTVWRAVVAARKNGSFPLSGFAIYQPRRRALQIQFVETGSEAIRLISGIRRGGAHLVDMADLWLRLTGVLQKKKGLARQRGGPRERGKFGLPKVAEV